MSPAPPAPCWTLGGFWIILPGSQTGDPTTKLPPQMAFQEDKHCRILINHRRRGAGGCCPSVVTEWGEVAWGWGLCSVVHCLGPGQLGMSFTPTRQLPGPSSGLSLLSPSSLRLSVPAPLSHLVGGRPQKLQGEGAVACGFVPGRDLGRVGICAGCGVSLPPPHPPWGRKICLKPKQGSWDLNVEILSFPSPERACCLPKDTQLLRQSSAPHPSLQVSPGFPSTLRITGAPQPCAGEASACTQQQPCPLQPPGASTLPSHHLCEPRTGRFSSFLVHSQGQEGWAWRG